MGVKDFFPNASDDMAIECCNAEMLKLSEARNFRIPPMVMEALSIIGPRVNVSVKHDVLFKLKNDEGAVVGYGKGMVCSTMTRLRSELIVYGIEQFKDIAVRMGYRPTADILEKGVCSYVYVDSEVKA